MKFSEIEQDKWQELAPYLDTCLLPVTGMTGQESPPEATACLERLRDMMDMVEMPFKGRVVTYPACHYWSDGPEYSKMLARWCEALRGAGFTYVIVLTANGSLELACEAADLVLSPTAEGALPEQSEVSAVIRALWS
ncbi:YpiF family protein [Paenibacillus sp. J5C_2022]|uniref:YpiF family protein n=1 Tax=Paenibacillus sp. J5C2022 TaxID=2977129 RepID=UPI0021CF9FDD|nr:YpiF family protein [Paenibacillus sp. J5C2022]MCU6708336.1 YpiF family protein [Paenibacillus sp. J5C2022]